MKVGIGKRQNSHSIVAEDAIKSANGTATWNGFDSLI
jgi:hypothetical protein